MNRDPHPFIVPGRRHERRNKLGVRCRVWHDGPYTTARGRRGARAPDANAFLCDAHALDGATITLLYEPDGSKQTTVRVIGARHVEPRTVPITRGEEA